MAVCPGCRHTQRPRGSAGPTQATAGLLNEGSSDVNSTVALFEIHMLGKVSSHGSWNGSIPRTIGWLPTGVMVCTGNCFSRAEVFTPGTLGL